MKNQPGRVSARDAFWSGFEVGVFRMVLGLPLLGVALFACVPMAVYAVLLPGAPVWMIFALVAALWTGVLVLAKHVGVIDTKLSVRDFAVRAAIGSVLVASVFGGVGAGAKAFERAEEANREQRRREREFAKKAKPRVREMAREAARERMPAEAWEAMPVGRRRAIVDLYASDFVSLTYVTDMLAERVGEAYGLDVRSACLHQFAEFDGEAVYRGTAYLRGGGEIPVEGGWSVDGAFMVRRADGQWAWLRKTGE